MQDVKIFAVEHRATNGRTKRAWIARWPIDGRRRFTWFRTKTEAKRFRSVLFEAQRRGEAFDPKPGEPLWWVPASRGPLFNHRVRRWPGEHWSEWQPQTRKSGGGASTRLVPLVVRSSAAPPPDTLRSRLVAPLVPGAEIDAETVANERSEAVFAS